MIRFIRILMALIACTLVAGPAFADTGCSIKKLAGNWVFATGIGQQNLPFPPSDGDITAIGTMNIYRDGSLEGRFDVTVFNDLPGQDIPYWGSIVVNSDCTGTLQFTTPLSSRTDSIVIVSRKEILGMSRDPLNLWTYQVRKIGSDDDEDND